jgi:membrane protease YdiL (CAAX protease family)
VINISIHIHIVTFRLFFVYLYYILNIDLKTIIWFNPLNAELNPIYDLLILLGDLKFMGPCIVSIFQYISNKMQRYTVYLYLETALNVSGGTSAHHQERIQLYLQHLVFLTPLLISAAIVEELEQV